MTQPCLFPELERSGPSPDAASDEWFTPRWVLDWLPPVDFDPCWSAASHVRPRLGSCDVRQGEDGLSTCWVCEVPAGGPTDGIVWVNPPYSDCAAWVEKCARESKALRQAVVAFVPARCGEVYWHRAVWGQARWVAFLRGRVAFDTDAGPAAGPGTFSQALICWGGALAAHDVLRHVQRAAGRNPPWVVQADAQLLSPNCDECGHEVGHHLPEGGCLDCACMVGA